MAKKKMKVIEFTDFRKLTISGHQPCISIPMEVWRKSNIPKGEKVLVEVKITPVTPKELVKRRKQ